MDYESVLRVLVGECGVFQVLALLLYSLSNMLGVEIIFHNFIAGYQQHWCHVPELQGVPYEQQRYIAIPTTSEGEYSSCEMFNISYDQYTMTDFYTWNRSEHDTAATITCTSWVYDQSQYISTISSEWDLVCDDQWKNPFISTMSSFGAMIGCFVSGSVADLIGRKPTLVVFMIIRLIGDYMTSLAPNYAVLCTARFLVGFTSVACWITSYTLLMELTGDKYRPVFGVVVNLSFSLGYSVVALFTYFIRDFRLSYLALSVPSTALLFAFILLPESARWLVAVRQYSKADRVFHKMAAINGRTFPDNFDYDSLQLQELNEKKTEPTSSQSAWKQYLTSRLLFQGLLVGLMWFVVSLVYTALSLNIGVLAGSMYVNLSIMGLLEIPGMLLSVVTAKWAWLGRRGTCGWFMAIAGAFNFIAVPFILNGKGDVATAISLVGKMFIAGAYNTINVFTAELFPTEIRNGGLGYSAVISNISSMLAPYAVVPLMNIWPPLASVVFGVCGVITGVFILIFLPETLGLNMAETVSELIERHRSTKKMEKDKAFSEQVIFDEHL